MCHSYDVVFKIRFMLQFHAIAQFSILKSLQVEQQHRVRIYRKKKVETLDGICLAWPSLV